MKPSPTMFTTSNVISPATSVIVAIAPTATGIPGQGKGSGPGAENGECQLLGPFAIIIQAALGGLALLSLVFKRWRERPQRPVKIWAFDVSKQVVGSILLHLANLLMSMLSSGQLKISATSATANPCSFYLLNLAIDTPFGSPPESIQSGNYGHPPRAKWWLKQSLIYFIGLLGMKTCVFFIFKLCPWIVNVGDWALRWTEGNEKVQVFFVMLFFPVIMNALQYYIIDGFIKNQKPSDHEPIPGGDGEPDDYVDGHVAPPGRDDWDAVAGSGDDEAEIVKKHGTRKSSSKKATGLKVDPKQLDEYDPNRDGEDSPTVASSGSNDLSKKEDTVPSSKNVEGSDGK
ncbi:MAG: hypothetical protein Q9187_004343 [Circinaria calcarea]